MNFKLSHHTHLLLYTLFFIANISLGILVLLVVVTAQYTRANSSFPTDSQISFVASAEDEETANVYATDEFTLGRLIEKEPNGENFILGHILEDTSSYTSYYITYEGGGVLISGIMNVPKGEGSFPLLVLNHGYIDPQIYTNGRGLKREQGYLAKEGFVVLHPDYRNHAESTEDNRAEVSFRTLYTEDVINAIEAVKKANFNFIDASRIGMLGHSMGGGITLNVITTKPDLVSAAVLYAPVSGNFEDIYQRWVVDADDAQTVEEQYGTPASNPLFWQGLSAETFYDRITVPLLIHQGDQDDEIPLYWTEDTVSILQSIGKDVTYFLYPGAPHEFITEWELFMKRTVDFFREEL